MRNRPPTHLLPTLDQLRPLLDVYKVNTGQSITYAPFGIVTDDIETLHAALNENGKVVLKSGTEFTWEVYRGQTEEHRPCVPSLGRKKHPEELLLDLCRNVAFEDVIGDHPYVQICEQEKFLENPIFVNRQGLAQHYGLSTDLLDVTSNFDVACFFATCHWSTIERRYLPVQYQWAPGVIYRIRPLELLEYGDLMKFHHLGWQPFHRQGDCIQTSCTASIVTTFPIVFNRLRSCL
jgi:FRG domain